MSRSGYSDDMDDNWQFIRWRGAVASALRGRRGQAFLNEMLVAMDALDEKKLISNDLERDGAVCAIGAVGKARGVDMRGIDSEDHERVASLFSVPHALACEIVYMNDERFWREKPEGRFTAMRAWIKNEIWNARGCIADPYSKHALSLSRRPGGWKSVIEWNEV